MSKYERSLDVEEIGELSSLVDPTEYVLYQGKPKKMAFVLNNAGALLPIAVVWLLFDGGIIATIVGGFLMTGGMGSFSMLGFVIPFFALHLMPVWACIGKFVKSMAVWKKSQYIITDRNVYVQCVNSDMKTESVPVNTIISATMKQQGFDTFFCVYDIEFSTEDGRYIEILDVKEGVKIYKELKKFADKNSADNRDKSLKRQKKLDNQKTFSEDYNPYR